MTTESKRLPILIAALALSFSVVMAFGTVWGPRADEPTPGDPAPTRSAPSRSTAPPDRSPSREDPAEETDEPGPDGSGPGGVDIEVGDKGPAEEQDYSVRIRTKPAPEDGEFPLVCVRVEGWHFANSSDWPDASNDEVCQEFSAGSLVIQGRQS